MSDAGPHATDAGKPDARVAIPKKDAGSVQPGLDAGAISTALEIIGHWHNNYDADEVITAATWTSYSTDAIIEFDNAHNWVITESEVSGAVGDASVAGDAGVVTTFNKIVWTEPSAGSFYYCFVDFGLTSAAAARASEKTADASDPATKGCGSFPWTKLNAK